MSQDFLLPMGVSVLHIALVGIYLVTSRIKAVRLKKLSPSYFKVYSGEIDSKLLVKGRHFDNQFQLPILFLITSIVAMNLKLDMLIMAAWVFVFSRIVHTWVHLGSNNIIHRMLSYLVGFLCVLVMWTVIIFKA